MAEVWSVPHTTLTFGLGQEFVSRGFDARWNCYDGGVRLYLPGLDPTRDLLGRHPLVLATRLLSHEDPTTAAAAWALGAVTRALGVDEWRAQWREGIAGRRPTSEGNATLADLEGLQLLHPVLADSRLASPSAPARETLEKEPEEARPIGSQVTVVGVEWPAPSDEAVAPDEPTEPTARAETPSARQDISVRESADEVINPVEARAHADDEARPEARARAAKAPPRPSRIQRGLASLRDAFDSFADLEGLLGELEGELEALRVERDALALERDELSQELQDLEQERVGREFRLPSALDDVLALFDEMGADTFRVTSYARRKARDSKYADLRLLGQVLSVLLAVGPDFGAVQSALGSSVGRRARARPKESKQTMAKFGQQRKFVLDDGSATEVEQHVTLGHGNRNLNETLQLYWRRAPDGATEIVYAGAHLPTVSENT